jgi:hypothetical protein
MRIAFAGKWLPRSVLLVLSGLGASEPLRADDGANKSTTGSIAPQGKIPTRLVYAEPIADVPTWLNDIVVGNESPIISTTFGFDGAPEPTPWSIVGGPDAQGSGNPADGQGASTANGNVLRGNFFQRLAQFYKQDWAGKNPAGSSPAKRGLAAPIDSPPFPFSDWGYGGSPDIGAPDSNTYPLMSALGLEKSRTKIYGWVAASINFST